MGNQGQYDSAILLDGSGRLYVAGEWGILYTQDGGQNWVIFTQDASGNAPAADFHSLAFGADGTSLLAGTDGGIWSWDTTVGQGGSGRWTDLNSNLATSLLSGIAGIPSDATRGYVSSQASGTDQFNNAQPWPMVDDASGFGVSPYGDTVRVDPNNPSTVYAWVNTSELVGQSGTATLRKSTDGGKTWTTLLGNVGQGLPLVIDPVTTLGAGATPVLHNVNVSYAGDANFQGSKDTTPAKVTVTQATTQTTISASLGESSYGQRVTFSAVVTPITGGGTPNGTVKFYDGAVTPANLLGSATLDSTGTASFPISSLAVGDHNVLAVYQGNSNYGSSTTAAAAFLTVDQASTNVNLTSSANPSFVAQSVTFTAAVLPVAPGAGTPTGTVTFMDGTTVLGTVRVSGGKALLATSALALGGHDITASYSGDTNFTGNTSSDLTQTVLPQTVASLSASVSNPSGVGVNTAFSITVTALDANGKQVFADFDAVSIVLLSGPSGGTLTGTLNGTFKNGTITFGGLKVTKPSTTTAPYKVLISSGGLTTTLTFVTGGRQT
jgi:hypothetical protein